MNEESQNIDKSNLDSFQPQTGILKAVSHLNQCVSAKGKNHEAPEQRFEGKTGSPASADRNPPRSNEQDNFVSALTVGASESLDEVGQDCMSDGSSTSDKSISHWPATNLDNPYSDLNPDRRFLEPKKYFGELQSIEDSVVERSALHLFRGNQEAYYHSLWPSVPGTKFQVHIKHDETDTTFTKSFDKVTAQTFDQLKDGGKLSFNPTGIVSPFLRAEAQYLLFHLLECRNLLARVHRNFTFLQEQDFIARDGKINLLVASPTRPGVVELLELDVWDLNSLVTSFSIALERLLDLCVKRALDRIPRVVASLDQSINIIANLGLRLWSSMTDDQRCEPQVAAAIWRSVSHGLDLAVISYCGAHIEPFDHSYLGYTLTCFDIGSTFVRRLEPGPLFQRQTLNCLNGFLHGKEVWVFDAQEFPSESAPPRPLYLRTTIEAFASVWGPVWQTVPVENPYKISRYNAGLGFIVPWLRALNSEPAPLEDEINCHWTADESHIPSGIEPFPDSIEKRLLIGGAAPSITTNNCCPVSAQTKTHHMRCEGFLKPVGTCGASKYRDSETIQVQIGSVGLGTAYQRQYNRRSGVSWKAQLVEAWKMEPDRRSPEVLETWSGLEISACSSNARRRRLIRILSSETMQNYLNNCQFEWTDKKCERAYFDALSSDNPEAFYDLYRRSTIWRKDLGRAVSWCLEKLLKTDVDDDGSLASFRCVGPRQEWTAMLHPVDHTWIGFLKDSPEKGTFSVSSETCLDFQYAGGLGCRSHGHRGHTVLETALEINPAAPRPEKLSKRPRSKDKGAVEEYRWSVSGLERGDKLSTGTEGTLYVEKPLAQAQLLMTWKPSSPWKLKDSRDRLDKRVFKRLPSPHHWELLEKPSFDCKPIPIHIISENWIDHSPHATPTPPEGQDGVCQCTSPQGTRENP
ncbi:hypothetical protein MMC16_006700 [Acarospora aff. strigata]|nr:hypothetical protein [Acarospora aff. strigata]